MNLNYSDIKEFLEQNPPKTPAEITAILLADPRTIKPIDRADLVHTLNVLNMLRKVIGNNSDEKWAGTVLVMQEAIIANGTEADQEAIRFWLSHVTNPTNLFWDTTQLSYASGFRTMAEFFGGLPGMPSVSDFETVLSLGGGYRFADVTETEVQAVIDAEALRKETESLQQVVQEAIDAEVSTRDDKVAPIDARYNNAVGWLSSYSVVGKTPAEVQAYVDGILASEDGNP